METQNIFVTKEQDEMIVQAVLDAVDVLRLKNDPEELVQSYTFFPDYNGIKIPGVKSSHGEFQLMLHTQVHPLVWNEEALLKITITPRPPFGEQDVVDAVVGAVVDELGEDLEVGELPLLRFSVSGKIDEYTGEITAGHGEASEFGVSISVLETERVRRIATRTIFAMLVGCRMVSRLELDAIRIFAESRGISALLRASRGHL